MEKDSYREGIDRAVEEGLIVVHGDRGLFVDDTFAHCAEGDESPSFGGSNTRMPDTLSLRIARMLGRGFNYWEFGPGAGVTACTMNERFGADVTTVAGLTPVNPSLRFVRAFTAGRDDNVASAVVSRCTEVLGSSRGDGVQLGVDLADLEDNLTFDLLMEIEQKLGIQIFDRGGPFIAKQHVGSLTDIKPADVGERADFMLERIAPFHYSREPEERDSIMREWAQRLSHRGVMYVRNVGVDPVSTDYGEDMQVSFGGSNRSLLVARKGSVIAHKMARAGGGFPAASMFEEVDRGSRSLSCLPPSSVGGFSIPLPRGMR